MTSFSLTVVLISLFAFGFVAMRTLYYFCDNLQPIVKILLTVFSVFFQCPPRSLGHHNVLAFYRHRNQPENTVSSYVPVFLVAPRVKSRSVTLVRYRDEGTLKGGGVSGNWHYHA